MILSLPTAVRFSIGHKENFQARTCIYAFTPVAFESYVVGVYMSSSSSSAFPAISLEFTIFGEIFAYVTIFF